MQFLKQKQTMIYTIKRGSHFASGFNFGIHPNGKTVSKTVKFFPNCAYDLGNTNQADINKLYGFSVGLFQSNQYNSARFGWRWSIEKQKIELLAYVYVNGKRINEWDQNIFITDINLMEEVYASIEIDSNKYKFSISKYSGGTISSAFSRAGSGTGYNQYPYFGGDEVAPHEMQIELK